MAEQDTAPVVDQPPVIVSTEQWKTDRGHTVTLPSGAVVKFQIPNLAVLAKTGQLPNSLLAVAVPGSVTEAEVTSPEEANERIARLADFQRWLIVQALIEPTVTEDEVADLPTEDVDMIVELATRGRDIDAVGHHIAGLEASADWRRFRGIDSGVEDLLDQ